VDETNSASRHSRTAAESPSSEEGPQSEGLDFAASVLQSLSKDNQQISDEQEALPEEALLEEPQDVFETSRSHEDGGFSAPQDLSQLSLSSPSGRPSLAPNHHVSSSVPVPSTQWQHSSPNEDARMYLNPGNTEEGSPFGTYNDNQLYQAETLPSIMDLELHNPTSLLSASSTQPLNLEEACLVRCFVEKLARAV
jgi:hypothetical protein